MAKQSGEREQLILAEKEFLFPAILQYYDQPLIIESAKDQYVRDVDGRQYLDFFGGIATISVGHLNDKVNRAIHRQVDRLQHVSTVFTTRPQVELAQRIAKHSPQGRLTKSYFTNSGSEANEIAVQLARCYTGNREIVALRHGYHGHTEVGRALTGHGRWRGTTGPPAGVLHAHNAYCYRCPFGKTYPSCELACAHDLKDLIETSTSGAVAGILAEPIQGIGGFITPPKEYFGIVAGIVRSHGGIVISDEVQTAWGRTGRWFGIEHYDVVPEVMTMAKGLGNGLPIGATTAMPEVADSLQHLTFSTFGGNPVTAAAARAVIDYVEELDLLTNAREVGDYLRERLMALQQQFPLIGDVRGMGLMRALELVLDRDSKEPATRQTAALTERAREQGLLVGRAGLHGNVVRISPPLNISRDDVDSFARMLKSALTAVAAR